MGRGLFYAMALVENGDTPGAESIYYAWMEIDFVDSSRALDW